MWFRGLVANLTDREYSLSLASEHTVWRYAAENATSQRVVLPILILLSFNSFPAGVYADAELLQAQVVIVLAASLAAWLFFTVVGLLINALTNGLTVARVISITMLYAVTEILRFGSIYWPSAPVQNVNHWGLVFNIVNAGATGLVLFGLLSIAVTDYSRYRTSYASLVRQTQRVQGALAEAESNVEQTRSEIVKFVRRQLSQDLNKALSMSERATANQSEMVDELFRISDEVVRPLSHELSYTVSDAVDVQAVDKPARVPFRVMLHEASLASPFKPVEVTFLIGIFTAPLLLAYSSPISGALWAVFMLMIIGVAWLGRKYLTPQLAKWPVAIRVVVTAVAFSLPVMFYTLFVIAPEFSGPTLGPLWFVYALVIGALLAGLLSISGGLRVARARSIDELYAVEAHLEWLNVRAQSQLWLDQKRLALTLHNEVQGSLLAAALKLRYAIESGPQLVDEVMPEVQDMIRACIDVQLISVKTHRLEDALSQLNENWSELIVMRLEAEADDVNVLEQDGLALEVVAELMREFQTNSLKHGRATQSVLQLERQSANSLNIRLTNNGTPLAADALSVGLGTRFLESVSLRHHIKNLESGVQLELEIPVVAA